MALLKKQNGNFQKQIENIKKEITDTQATAPKAGTAADLETGTSEEPMIFTAKQIHDEIARQIAAIPAA